MALKGLILIYTLLVNTIFYDYAGIEHGPFKNRAKFQKFSFSIGLNGSRENTNVSRKTQKGVTHAVDLEVLMVGPMLIHWSSTLLSFMGSCKYIGGVGKLTAHFFNELLIGCGSRAALFWDN